MRPLLPLLVLLLAGCGSGSGADAPTGDAEFINAMVKKTGGDATKLSADERAKLDKVTKGETETVLKMGAGSALPPAPPYQGK